MIAESMRARLERIATTEDAVKSIDAIADCDREIDGPFRIFGRP
jgi:hypothetical protein